MPARKKPVPATLTFRIDPATRKKLAAVAQQHHISESALVDKLVQEGLGRSDVITRVDVLELRVSELELSATHALTQINKLVGVVRVGSDEKTPRQNEAAPDGEGEKDPDGN